MIGTEIEPIHYTEEQLLEKCKCGCTRMTHMRSTLNYKRCRICTSCNKFKLPKPLKLKKVKK
jgi:hypothetical protein